VTLPPKPEAVAHVSDLHWEAALDAAAQKNKAKDFGIVGRNFHPDCVEAVIDHARCLILLGEVAEPVDPIEAAMDALFEERCDIKSPDAVFHKARLDAFKAQCRKHFSGLTFPEAQS
jgi:hypothetical protein